MFWLVNETIADGFLASYTSNLKLNGYVVALTSYLTFFITSNSVLL